MNDPVCIYCPLPDTPRLRYVLDWLFCEQLGLSYRLLADRQLWNAAPGAKICYADEDVDRDIAAIRIRPVGLLSEVGLRKPWPLSVQRWKHTTVLFYNQPGADIPFDLFAAVFYLISRYEEYLPHERDQHGRYKAMQSAAGQYGFLDMPVIDRWIRELRRLLCSRFGWTLAPRAFTCQMTFDVDMAWKYCHKGAGRYWGAQLRDLLLLRIAEVGRRSRTVKRPADDPYFSFPALEALHRRYGIHVTYFFLLGRPGGPFDRNAAPTEPPMQELINRLQQTAALGIHPSYRSNEQPSRLDEEMAILADTLQAPVTRSRQHFIRLQVPVTCQRLIDAGIRDDYSMGYATHNGFRAGTSLPFFWYDLTTEAPTELRLHPFGFMDATSKYYGKKDADGAFREWKHLYDQVKSADGNFVSIWHNFILQNDSDWLTMYENVLKIAYVTA